MSDELTPTEKQIADILLEHVEHLARVRDTMDKAILNMETLYKSGIVEDSSLALARRNYHMAINRINAGLRQGIADVIIKTRELR